MNENDSTSTLHTTPPPPEFCDVPCFEEEVVRRIQVDQPGEGSLEGARRIFALLADRNRLLILHALREAGELCVCDLAHVLGCSVATASHHLKRLRDGGLVGTRRDGKLVLYSIRRPWVVQLSTETLREVGRV